MHDKPFFDHTLQTIQEEISEAENTFNNSKPKKTLPSNAQDAPSSQDSAAGDSDDRDDDLLDSAGESSTDVSSSNVIRQDFTFMGNDNESKAAFDQISKFTSVEQYRDFLEKELGEEKLMKAYPLLKEFGDQILFFEKTPELEKILKGVLTL